MLIQNYPVPYVHVQVCVCVYACHQFMLCVHDMHVCRLCVLYCHVTIRSVMVDVCISLFAQSIGASLALKKWGDWNVALWVSYMYMYTCTCVLLSG